VIRTARFYARCRALPAAHRHCVHGHIEDCPHPMTCRLLPANRDRLVDVISAGRMCWVLPSGRLAAAQVVVLRGDARTATVTHWQRLTSEQADALVAGLPEGTVVEDYR
jgi:hypothetical protein